MIYRSILQAASTARRQCSLKHSTALNTNAVRVFSTRTVVARSGEARFPGEKVTSDPQIGDYPNLPWVHYEDKNPLKYWDRQGRRNLGDTVHEQDELLNAFSADIQPLTAGRALFQLGVFASGIATICLAIKYLCQRHHMQTKRTYPYDGLSKELGLDPADPNEVRVPARNSSEVVI
ncbi:hypothetical protein BDF19DRAFT_413380 [Syncephalis fuscata]|nr:hypothetical protein BDF19DRAFT_413380 [Syncephalis fuscata]